MTTNIELEFIRSYAYIRTKTSEFKTKLGVMRDMHSTCKLGVSQPDRVLYIDKPSIFQGVSRWFYSQNRNVITNYLYEELMGSEGLVSLVSNLRDKCSELFMYFPTSGRKSFAGTGSTGSTGYTGSISIGTTMRTIPYHTLTVSDTTRNTFKMLCISNIDLLNIVSHGLGKLYSIYEDDFENDELNMNTKLNSTTLSSSPPLSLPSFHAMYKKTASYFQEPPDPVTNQRVMKCINEMQKRIKFERVMLETVYSKFNDSNGNAM